MAKYDVRHICGHTSVKQLYGNDRGRQATLAYLRTVPCWECLRLIEIDQAEAHADREGLPALIGSDKQISWALVLRHKSLVMIERVATKEGWDREAAVPVPEPVNFAPDETTTITALVDQLRRRDIAKWWIDHTRDVSQAGKPQDIGGGWKVDIQSEYEFVLQLFRDSLGLDRPTAAQKVASGDLQQMMGAVIGYERHRNRARRSG